MPRSSWEWESSLHRFKPISLAMWLLAWQALRHTRSDRPQAHVCINRRLVVQVLDIKLLEEILVIIVVCTAGFVWPPTS